MIGKNSNHAAQVEPIVSKIAHEVYFVESFSLIKHADLVEYCQRNGVDYDASFLTENQEELLELKEEELRHKAGTVDFRSLSITLHRILGVSRFLFAEKLAAVSEAYVEVVSLISKVKGYSELSVRSAAAEYALKTMHLMLQQAVTETVEYLNNYQVQAKVETAADLEGRNFEAYGMERMDA